MENEKVLEQLKQETEKKIEEVMKQGLQPNNIDMIYSLVDIHKDIANEEYWKEKGEAMRYSRGGYGEGPYNARGRGSYSEGSYGRRRRDSRGRYMGSEKIDEMRDHYGRYMDGRERYGHDGETEKSFDYMLMSLEDFAEHLFEEADSQEQIEKIKKTAKRISEM
jgi:hypothetical protein